MTSKPVSALLVDLGVTRTHSRPRVSNDNPYAEAQFKTLKYLHDFPASFGGLIEAREFPDGFFTEYNHVHRHSAGSDGTQRLRCTSAPPGAVDDARQATLDAARATRPERFARRPRPPKIPDQSALATPPHPASQPAGHHHRTLPYGRPRRGSLSAGGICGYRAGNHTHRAAHRSTDGTHPEPDACTRDTCSPSEFLALVGPPTTTEQNPKPRFKERRASAHSASVTSSFRSQKYSTGEPTATKTCDWPE